MRNRYRRMRMTRTMEVKNKKTDEQIEGRKRR